MVNPNIKTLRGDILRFIYSVYPDGLPEDVVFHSLYQYNRYEIIASAIAYLVDKKYLDKKETPHPYKNGHVLRWYKTTPLGIDLIERTTTDQAIEFSIEHEGRYGPEK